MAGTTGVPACHSSAQLKPRVLEFLKKENPPIGRLLQLATSPCECLLQFIKATTTEDQIRFVNKVDRVCPTLDAQNARLFALVGEVCSSIDRPPASAEISARLGKLETSGDLTDIWFGKHDGEDVVLKAFRTYPDESMRKAKMILWKRVPVWKRFSHPNLIGFRGVDASDPSRLALIYDLAVNGNVVQYTETHPDASRPALLLQVAKGLQYLHSLDMPHGNLKGANVVVDGSGHARLTDCGFAPINFCIRSTASTAGNVRWLAPEMVHGTTDTVMESKPADIFAFAMVAIEVFTGNVPFSELGKTGAATRIFRGGRPECPMNARKVGLTPQMWKFIQRCWDSNPEERPTIKEVVRTWEGFMGNDEFVQGASGVQDRGGFVPGPPSGPGPVPARTGTGGRPNRMDVQRTRPSWRMFLCGLGGSRN